MNNRVLALGTLLTLGGLEARAFDEPPAFEEPPQLSTPVLYDIGWPSEIFTALNRNPEQHFGYAKQILRALGNAVENGEASQSESGKRFLLELPEAMSGTFSVNVSPTSEGAWVISGHTKMEPGSPYVYGDNIIWTVPGCKQEGRSHLTHVFRMQKPMDELKQSVNIGEKTNDVTSEVELKGAGHLSVSGTDSPESAEMYKKFSEEVICKIERALK